MLWPLNLLTKLVCLARGLEVTTQVAILLSEKRAGWAGCTRRPPATQVIADLRALCALYAPKMIYNAQCCPETLNLLDAMGVLLHGADESGLTTPGKFADYWLSHAHLSLLEEIPAGPSRARKITAEIRSDHLEVTSCVYRSREL